MSEFKAIETQEEFDAAIQKRLERKEREVQEKYREYLSPGDADRLKKDFEKQLADKESENQETIQKYAATDQKIADLTKRAEEAERSLLRAKVANESKLPYELSSRIIGDTEEDMRKDAETLASFLKPQGAPPPYSSQPSAASSVEAAKDAAYMDMLSQLTN